MVLLNALSVVSTVLVLLCHHRGYGAKENGGHNSVSNQDTSDTVTENAFRNLILPICCGKEKKHMSGSPALNNALLLLFMTLVIGLTIGIMTRMTKNN